MILHSLNCDSLPVGYCRYIIVTKAQVSGSNWTGKIHHILHGDFKLNVMLDSHFLRFCKLRFRSMLNAQTLTRSVS